MRTVVIAVICLLLGLATGYMVSSMAGGELTPAKLEEGIRQNPRMVMDLLHHYPEEMFDIVLEGQNLKREKERQDQIAEQLENPLRVTVSEERPVFGPKDAPINIVEFSDFQCPHCANANKVIKELLARHPDKLNLVFLHMPLSSHEMAPLAAAYFEAAAMQDKDKAWQLHDILFEHRQELAEGGKAWLDEQAKNLGLDTDKIEEALRGERIKGILQRDLQTANMLQLRGAPSFLVGGVLISGAAPISEFEEVISRVMTYRAEHPDKTEGGVIFVPDEAAAQAVAPPAENPAPKEEKPAAADAPEEKPEAAPAQ